MTPTYSESAQSVKFKFPLPATSFGDSCGSLGALWRDALAPLTPEDLRGALRCFFYQKAHLGMRGLEIGFQAVGAQFLRSGRTDRSDRATSEACPQRLLLAHFGSNLQQVRNLDAGGEENHVNLFAGQRSHGGLERSDVYGQSPAINGDARDARATFLQTGEQFLAGDAVFLHGDAQATGRLGSGLCIQSVEELTPRIRLGGGNVGGHAELAQRCDGLRPARHHAHAPQRRRVLLPWADAFSHASQSACAYAGQEDDHVEFVSK